MLKDPKKKHQNHQGPPGQLPDPSGPLKTSVGVHTQKGMAKGLQRLRVQTCRDEQQTDLPRIRGLLFLAEKRSETAANSDVEATFMGDFM